MRIKFKTYFPTILLFIFIFCYKPVFSEGISPAEIFLKRHSSKAYDPSQQVTDQHLSALVEAARWAPSSHNDQPWNFIFCDKHKNPEAYLKAFDSLKVTQQKWVQNAPMLVIVIARSKDSYKGKHNEWADYDTGAAALSMALQASEMGLMAHQIGGFNKEKIRESFQLPEDHQPRTIMVLGVEPAEGDPKATTRTRKPVHENFFLGEWGMGLSD